MTDLQLSAPTAGPTGATGHSGGANRRPYARVDHA
jgi:hypothetical protein